MTKRKEIVIISDSDSDDGLKNKRRKSCREHKSISEKYSGSEVVVAKGVNKQKNDINRSQTDTTKHKGMFTRGRARKLNSPDSDVEIIENDTPINIKNGREVKGTNKKENRDSRLQFKSCKMIKPLSSNSGSEVEFIQNEASVNIRKLREVQNIVPNNHKEKTTEQKNIDYDYDSHLETTEQYDLDSPLETTEKVVNDPEIDKETVQQIEKTIEQNDVDLPLATTKKVDNDPELDKESVQHTEKTTEEVDNNSKAIEETAQHTEKTTEQNDVDLPLETTEEVDNDSEIVEESVQHTEKTTEKVDNDSKAIKEPAQHTEKITEKNDVDLPLDTTEKVYNDSKAIEEPAQHTEKITEKNDVDLPLETTEKFDNDSEIVEETVQNLEKSTEQNDYDSTLETSEEVVEVNIQDTEISTEQNDADTFLGKIEEVDVNLNCKNAENERNDAGIPLGTIEQVCRDPETNKENIKNTETTKKQMDACVCTAELEELLKKKQIYPWTQLHRKITENKNYIADADDCDSGENGKKDQCIQTVPVAKHWQHIISAMEDPGGVISYTDNLLVIKERQPKGRFHYLILPIENMRNLNELTKEHMPLLEKMEEAAKKVISTPEHLQETFCLGFIAKPTMIVLRNQKFLWLHLHVISNTPNFAYVTKKQIWNTFHSKMFITMQEVKNSLATTGSVSMPTPEDCNFYLQNDAFCDQCDFKSSKFPKFIEHINEEHLQKGKGKGQTKRRK